MSWHVSRKGDKYRFWSTISDKHLSDWMSRNEAIKFYHDCALVDFKKNVIEQFYKFPHMWVDRDSNNYNRIDDEEGHKRWSEWLGLLSSTRDPDAYVELINETYEKIMKEIDID